MTAAPNGAHSYDPGISPNGLFWTVPIPEDGVHVDFHAGKAVLQVVNLPVHDVFTVGNSFAGTISPVIALFDSLRIEWSGVTDVIQFSDSTDKFTGKFKENSATIQVTTTTPANACLGTHGFHFVSDTTTASHFAQIGRERNGAFFNKEDGDEEDD
jgi:hypothetical protein